MQKNARHLAVIMFTDIVGYTSLMQKDENKAIKIRKRHRDILEKSIQTHNGQLVQYYGDGTLSTFGSVIEAIECSVKIQQELQKEPIIPLRIGMHIGDIVYSDDGIYGDAVNVASRIENLSVSGGVLISEKVYDEIKNQHEFSTILVGEFKLKNVESPIELFAITNEGLKVPEKKAHKSLKLETELNVPETQYPILETKLYVPPSRPDLVKRTHLFDRMNKDTNRKLTLISAPAGFGKTTFISEWISQNEIPAGWISLDKGDNDYVQFIHYIIAAFQNFDSNIGEPALIMLQSAQQPSIELIMTNLIKEITNIPYDFVLVLDDYHLIDAKQVHSIVEFLIDHQPTQMHLVITTRVDPPLQLARLRVRNQLAELRAIDLSFLTNEISDFFNKVMKLGLSIEEINILENRTEGWVAGLHLAALSLQGRDDKPEFIKTFAGDDRYIVDYLAEEVLNSQPAHIRIFLLQTSILNRLSEPLCDFVTNKKGSQQILDELERTNMFIVPLDNKRNWYRYHHLFADLLRQRLQKTENEQIKHLHLRASEWFKEHGYYSESIEHSLSAEESEMAASLMEENLDAIWKHGEHTKFKKWLDKLPIDLLYSKPQLCIFQAWYLFAGGQYEAAERVLKSSEDSLNSSDCSKSGTKQPDLDPILDYDKLKFLGRAAAVRAFMAAHKGDVSGIIHYAQKALDILPEKDFSWRSSVAIVSADAQGFKGDMNAAYKARLKAWKVCEDSGDIYFTMIAALKVAITLRAQGRLQETVKICEEQMQFAKQNGIGQTVGVGWLLAIWGEVLVELNNLDEALNYANKGVKMTEDGGDLASLGWSYLCLVRILFSRGDLSLAEDTIQRCNNINAKFDMPPWITNLIAGWQVRIWLKQNNFEAISQWVEERELKTNWEFKISNEMNYFLLIDYIVLARFQFAQGKLDDTSVLLQRLHELAKKKGRNEKLIEILILQSLVFRTDNNLTQSMTSLERALKLAEPEGFIRIFIEEGKPIAELLEKILASKKDIPRAYVKKLLSAFSLQRQVKTESGYVEQISERELEVLRLIAGGLSNKQIMDELFISLSTVKTHIMNIYNKLNVHSRTEAIIKAKDLNLL
jgi:ATP/maltotriose-dependent transcriptional regulator MalT/class 3 adenylate cyclase